MYLSADSSGRVTLTKTPDARARFTLLCGAAPLNAAQTGSTASGAALSATTVPSTANSAVWRTPSASSAALTAARAGVSSAYSREFAAPTQLEAFGTVKLCDAVVLKSHFGSFLYGLCHALSRCFHLTCLAVCLFVCIWQCSIAGRRFGVE
jgi:hypothetical protein